MLQGTFLSFEQADNLTVTAGANSPIRFKNTNQYDSVIFMGETNQIQTVDWSSDGNDQSWGFGIQATAIKCDCGEAHFTLSERNPSAFFTPARRNDELTCNGMQCTYNVELPVGKSATVYLEMLFRNPLIDQAKILDSKGNIVKAYTDPYYTSDQVQMDENFSVQFSSGVTTGIARNSLPPFFQVNATLGTLPIAMYKHQARIHKRL